MRGNEDWDRVINPKTSDNQEVCPFTGKKGYVKEEDCHCFCCNTHSPSRNNKISEDTPDDSSKEGGYTVDPSLSSGDHAHKKGGNK